MSTPLLPKSTTEKEKLQKESQLRQHNVNQKILQSKRKELSEIPSDLKKLIKLFVTAIYPPEKIVIINCLMFWHCLKEEDIKKITCLGKMIEPTLRSLKNDRFLDCGSFLEIRAADDPGPTPYNYQHNRPLLPGQVAPDPTKPKKTKIIYWFINYKTIVNIINYKIHKMMQKAEQETKDNAAKASFHCTEKGCMKEFTELDMNQLTRNAGRLNFYGEPEGFMLTCDFCGNEVIEDETKKRDDLRSLPATLNERLKFANSLITDHLQYITLIPKLTQPRNAENIPEDYEKLKELAKDKNRVAKLIDRSDNNLHLGGKLGKLGAGNSALANSAANASGAMQDGVWKEGKNYSIPEEHRDITIEFISNSDLRKMKMQKSTAKEVPIWMRQSTVKGAEVDAFKPEDRVKQFNLFLDDMKDDDDLIIDDEEGNLKDDLEDDNGNPKAKKKKKGHGKGRWWNKRNDEVLQTLREHEKINDDDKNVDDSDDDDDDSDSEMHHNHSHMNHNDFNNRRQRTGSTGFIWPEVPEIYTKDKDGRRRLRTYDELLSRPALVDSLSERQRSVYKNFALKHNISYMF